MAARFVNLTPHEILLVLEDKKIKIPSHGSARLKTSQKIVSFIDNIPVVETTFGQPEVNVNVNTEGAIIIVSMLLGSMASVLKDMLSAEMIVAPDTSPSSAIRDKEGKIIGVKQLVRLA